MKPVRLASHLLVAVCLLQLSIGRCAAAGQGDWDACTSGDTSRNIAACSRIIEDPSTPSGDRVDAYIWRGGAYVAENLLSTAISDYGSAIKIDPRNITAF